MLRKETKEYQRALNVLQEEENYWPGKNSQDEKEREEKYLKNSNINTREKGQTNQSHQN